MAPKLRASDYFLSWIVMVLCYVVTWSMVGFVFNAIGMAAGFDVRNQGRLLSLITMPVQLVTSYFCFRFLAKELAAKAVEKALDEKRDADRAKAAAAKAQNQSSGVAPLTTDTDSST
ncbi:MAG: hypothetical protein QM790_10120 [Nibricoccus sp.]